ncbi:hypothetical protein [Bradyrhizobium sp. RD5-C2]|uniref:hypothetical protein n=1 Tax=Bradyrhizobium sp. RD5-C2 TaxID=244562 RepID=UPI001CC539AD|nr:hypothetical protein [Bradyrhizobium sp. RD5-C2]
MNELTRRRDKESAREKWNICYDDVCIGSIGLRAGVPNHADQWEWKCGFHPGCDRSTGGPAETFEQARAAFEAEWRLLLPTRFPGLARPARLDQAQAGDVGSRQKLGAPTRANQRIAPTHDKAVAGQGLEVRGNRAVGIGARSLVRHVGRPSRSLRNSGNSFTLGDRCRPGGERARCSGVINGSQLAWEMSVSHFKSGLRAAERHDRFFGPEAEFTYR